MLPVGLPCCTRLMRAAFSRPHHVRELLEQMHEVGTRSLPLVVLALCTAFGAPIVEELAFRGLVFGSFRRLGVSVAVSVVSTAAVFAAFHLEAVRFPLLFTIGLVLGTVRATTDSTAASMLSHMVVNIPGALGILLLLQ